MKFGELSTNAETSALLLLKQSPYVTLKTQVFITLWKINLLACKMEKPQPTLGTITC